MVRSKALAGRHELGQTKQDETGGWGRLAYPSDRKRLGFTKQNKPKRAGSDPGAVGVPAQEAASSTRRARHRQTGVGTRPTFCPLPHKSGSEIKIIVAGRRARVAAYVMQQYALVTANNQPSVCLHSHLIPASWKTFARYSES